MDVGATYRNAKTYRDNGSAVIVQVSGRVRTTTEVPMSLVFARPNLLKLDAGQYEAVCDGKQLYFAVPPSRQYTLAKAPDVLDRRVLQSGSIMGGIEEGHPEIIDLLTRDDAVQTLLRHIRSIKWLADAVVDGRMCRGLSWDTGETRMTVFIDRERKLLLRAEGASAPGAEASPDSTVDSVRMTYRFAPVDYNSEIKLETFAVPQPKNYRRVREIGGEEMPDSNSQKPGSSPITGTNLPPFTGTDLSGVSLQPDEYKGKALLMFFWSASGSEHSLTAIPVIQALADRYKDDPSIAVLAVNTDQSPRPMAPQVLERKKATFRCLTDESFTLRKLFKLGGVPTLLLADRDGVVRWAQLGAPPTLKADLEAEIAKILPR